MREYMKSLGSVMMLIALANMLIPEGSMKKFTALATGFILITAAITVIPDEIGDFSFSSESFNLSEKEMSEAQSEYQRQVIDRHCKNLENLIDKQLKHGSDVTVQTDENGNITSVTLRIKGDESRAISYIVNELKFPRERIKIINEKN